MNISDILINCFFPVNNTLGFCLCIFIAAVAVAALLSFTLKTNRILAHLRKANGELEQYNTQTISEKFEDISQTFSVDDSIMKAGWTEYNKTLLKQSLGDGSVRVYSTVDASVYFNEATLLTDINLDGYLSVPGYLTGLGIFGTFFGLTMGLGGIDVSASDVAVLKAGIAGLLSGLGTAFSTSLWGLIGATAFSLIARRRMYVIKNTLSRLQNNINSKFVCITSEHILSKMSQAMEQQVDQLKKFNQEVAFAIGDQLCNALNESIQPTLTELLSAINELNKSGSATIAESLNNSVGDQLGGFAEILREAGNNLRDNSRSTEDMIQKMNEQFVNSTVNVTRMLEEASQKQNNATDTMMANTQQMMASIRDSIQAMQRSMAENSLNIGAELNNGLKETLSSMNGHIASLMSNFESAQNASVSGLTETIETIKTSLVNITDKFEESNVSQRRDLEVLTDNLTKKLMNISDNFADMHENSTRQIENSLVELEEFFGAIKEVSKQASNIAAKLSAVASPLNASASMLEHSITDFKQSQGKIMQQFNGIMYAMQENQSAYNKNITSLNALFTEIKNTISYYNSSLKGTNAELDAVFKTLSDKVREYNIAVGDNLNKYLRAYDEKISAGMSYLGSGIEELSTTIDELGGIVNRLKNR